MQTNLTEKTIVVTGATSGIGLSIAEQLAQQGAWVIGIGRSAERCRAAEERLRFQYPAARIGYIVANLALQSQVRYAADQVGRMLAGWGRSSLDGLVNNAGTFTFWLELTAEGFETQWAVNHLAPFLLTACLLPLLKAAPAARVVTISSQSHRQGKIHWQDVQLRRGYNGLKAYEQSKLANVLFTLELNRRLADTHVRAYAADPGLVDTAIAQKGTPAPVRWFWGLRRRGGSPPEVPAGEVVQLLGAGEPEDPAGIYWKAGKPCVPSRAALDLDAASRLWALSAQMCGLPAES